MNRFGFDSEGNQGWLYYQGHCIFSGPVEFARKLHRAVPVPSGSITLQVVLRRKHKSTPKELSGGLSPSPDSLEVVLNQMPPAYVWSWGEVQVRDAEVLRRTVRIPTGYADLFYKALRSHKLTGLLHLVAGSGDFPPAEPQIV